MNLNAKPKFSQIDQKDCFRILAKANPDGAFAYLFQGQLCMTDRVLCDYFRTYLPVITRLAAAIEPAMKRDGVRIISGPTLAEFRELQPPSLLLRDGQFHESEDHATATLWTPRAACRLAILLDGAQAELVRQELHSEQGRILTLIFD